jgi:hypothetical protein
MGRSKKNYDHLVDFFGNYLSVNSITGVTRLINGSPNDLRLNPPTGLGDVTIDIHPNTTLLRTGDDISRLNNDVGYIKGLDYLDEIGDVNVPTPDRDNVLTWDGNEWVAKPTKVPDAFLFRGRINVDVDHPEPDPQYGWTYVQSAAGTNALPSWVGIAGDAVQEKDLVIYAVTDEWQVVSNPFQGPNITDLQVVINPEDESYRGGHLQYNPDTGAFFFTPAYTQEFADLDNPLFQPDTYDERYVRRSGDLMSGDLSFSDNLKVRFLGEGDINAVTELRLGAGIAGTGLKLTDTTIESERLNVQFWVGNGAPEPGNPGSQVPTLSSRLDSSYGPLFSYYGQVAEDYNIVNKIYVDDLIDDTLEKCLRIDGSNGMKGDINMNGPNPTIFFNSSDSNISFKNNTRLTVGPHGNYHNQEWSQLFTAFRRKGVRFYTFDDQTVLNISLDHPTNADGYATYDGQIISDNHLVNKRYVDQADGQVAVEIVELESRVKDNEDRLNGILDEVAAEGYIKGVTVKETITGAPGTDAEVVDDKGELTFTIPQGQKGERGQPGFNGTKGTGGVKGDKGQKGDQGIKGQKGQRGLPGSNGTDGVNPEIGAGTATKLGSSAAPTVTERTDSEGVTRFDFGIPAGEKGQKGSGQKGQKGQKGADGTGGGGATIVYRNGAYYVSP